MRDKKIEQIEQTKTKRKPYEKWIRERKKVLSFIK